MNAELYGTNQVVRIAQATPRQLQWWDERKIVTPPQSGHRRGYNAFDALEVFLVAELRRRKFSLRSVRAVLKTLYRNSPSWADDALAAGTSSDIGCVLTDGHTARYLVDPGDVVAIMLEKRTAFVCIPLADAVQRIPGFTLRN